MPRHRARSYDDRLRIAMYQDEAQRLKERRAPVRCVTAGAVTPDAAPAVASIRRFSGDLLI